MRTVPKAQLLKDLANATMELERLEEGGVMARRLYLWVRVLQMAEPPSAMGQWERERYEYRQGRLDGVRSALYFLQGRRVDARALFALSSVVDELASSYDVLGDRQWPVVSAKVVEELSALPDDVFDSSRVGRWLEHGGEP